jgi:hypothetical protein
MKPLALVNALVLSALLLACGGTTRGQAKNAGAQALGCPIQEVEQQSHGGASYTVTGCGHSVDVDCVDPRTVDRSEHPEGHTFCRAGKVR